MPRGEKLFRFLGGLMLDRFPCAVTIRSRGRQVTHVETESRPMWRCKDLPERMSESPLALRGPRE